MEMSAAVPSISIFKNDAAAILVALEGEHLVK
jgi:hypothetical protein